MKRLVYLPVLLTQIVVLECCRQNTTSASPDLAYGTTLIYEEDLSRSTDMKGTRVTLEGESLETSTDSAGKWIIWNPPHHPFTVAVSRPGYGTNKFEVREYDGGEVSNVGLPLYHEPLYTVSSIQVSIAGDSIAVSGSPTTEPSYRHWYFLYFGKTPPLSNNPSTWLGSVGTIRVIEGETGFHAWTTRSSLLTEGVQSNDTVHVAVFSGSSTYSGYFMQSAAKYVVTTGISSVPKRTMFVLP